jgi:hypothetical protein
LFSRHPDFPGREPGRLAKRDGKASADFAGFGLERGFGLLDLNLQPAMRQPKRAARIKRIFTAALSRQGKQRQHHSAAARLELELG